MTLSVDHVLDRQPFGGVDPRVVVRRSAADVRPIETAVGRPGLARRQPSPRGQTLVEAQGIVERQARPEFERRRTPIAEERNQELERLHQVRRDSQQGLALPQVEPHQPEVHLFEISQPAVDDAGGRGGGAAAEVRLFDEGDPEAAERRIAGHTAADDAAADHHHIERFSVETRNPAHVRSL